MPSCSGTKPNYAGFVSDYLSYATTAASQLGVSIAFILCQWYQEWGLPANNPAWQLWCPEKYYPPYGWCGSFPMFDTKDEGTDAYVMQMRYYCDDSKQNVFGDTVNVWPSYNWGFRGGQTANCKDESGSTVPVTSQHFYGAIETGGNGTTGTYAANEAIGASPWSAGHYFRYSYGDTYPGRRLNVILNNSGWAPQYCYIP